MPAASPATVPDAKAALLAALRARPALQDVQVEWAHPGKGIQRETIYLGDTLPYEQSAKTLGNQHREETYELEVVVTVERAGNDPEAAERRVWELLFELAAVLREDAELGGAVRVAQYRASPVRNFVGAQKRVAESVARVTVTAEV